MRRGYDNGISRKYRLLARLPPGKTGLEALREFDPELAKRFLDNANEMAAQQYMRVYSKDQVELSREEFHEFLKLTGRGPVPKEFLPK